MLQVGALSLDDTRHLASFAEEDLDLSPKEYALLRFFMKHQGEVLSQERLLEHVWDEHADPFTNTVRVTIANLRRKLSAAGATDMVETVTGVGYRLREVL